MPEENGSCVAVHKTFFCSEFSGCENIHFFAFNLRDGWHLKMTHNKLILFCC